MLGNRSLVLFDSGDEITVTAGEEGIRFLLVSGRPLEEPVAWYGPIVMNTRAEIQQAYAELKDGTFIKHVAREGARMRVRGRRLLTAHRSPARSRPCKIHAMKISRRTFVHTGAAAGIGLGAAACSPPSPTASAGQALLSAQAQSPAPASGGMHPALARPQADDGRT